MEIKEEWSDDAKRILMEEKPMSRDERVKRLVADMEHAMKHNAPVTGAMMAEMRDLLGVPGE